MPRLPSPPPYTEAHPFPKRKFVKRCFESGGLKRRELKQFHKALSKAEYVVALRDSKLSEFQQLRFHWRMCDSAWTFLRDFWKYW